MKALAGYQDKSSAVTITTEDLIRDGFRDHPEFHCLMADDDDEIIVMVFYFYGYSTWVDKSIKLDDLIVKDGQREKGIGHNCSMNSLELHMTNRLSGLAGLRTTGIQKQQHSIRMWIYSGRWVVDHANGKQNSLTCNPIIDVY